MVRAPYGTGGEYVRTFSEVPLDDLRQAVDDKGKRWFSYIHLLSQLTCVRSCNQQQHMTSRENSTPVKCMHTFSTIIKSKCHLLAAICDNKLINTMMYYFT